jgi:hypothetical protein
MLIKHVVSSLKNYWLENSEQLVSLKIVNVQSNLKISIPLQLEAVNLPKWANNCGVNGQLLVPKECVDFGNERVDWKKVDWWTAIFLMMEGWHERIWEKKYGVIHSYSFRLKGWDTRAWDHAWVNRIALFLRKWFCVEFKKIDDFFGQLPKAKLILSHDIDAVSKSLPIRLKQSAFNLLNSLRYLLKGNIIHSVSYLGKGFRMLLSNEDWWVFDKLLEIEEKAGIKAVCHFYADSRPKNLKRGLMDPSYDASKPNVRNLFEKLKKEGHEIGLHPSYDCWNDSVLLENQKQFLEKNAGIEINKCRQHWLRFSWRDTWVAQSSAGIETDSTLMFNDRPGFRNSSAIQWHPWNTKSGSRHQIMAQTSVLMDSHLYDYQALSAKNREKEISSWVDECKKVHGRTSFLWHPHTLSSDYGWEEGFTDLLEKIS